MQRCQLRPLFQLSWEVIFLQQTTTIFESHFMWVALRLGLLESMIRSQDSGQAADSMWACTPGIVRSMAL